MLDLVHIRKTTHLSHSSIKHQRMASFLIAGNVETSLFSHAERLLDILRQTLPVCQVRKYVTTSEKWEQAQAELCKEYKFDAKEVSTLQCVVWHEDGRYIGGAEAFSKYCKSTYNVDSDLVDTEQLKAVAKENTKVVLSMFQENQAAAANSDVALLLVGSTSTLY